MTRDRSNYTLVHFYKSDKEKVQNHIKNNNIAGGMANFLMSLFNEHTAEKLTTPTGIVGTANQLINLYRQDKITKKKDTDFILNLFVEKEKKQNDIEQSN